MKRPRKFVTSLSSTTAETQVRYYAVGALPIIVLNHLLVGINPAAVDADDVTSSWSYSVTGDGGGTPVALSTVAAFEYNDTTDTNALGDIGDSTAATVTMSADINVRVPAYALLINTNITTGTVTSLALLDVLEYAVA